jgi:hypothetical protein
MLASPTSNDHERVHFTLRELLEADLPSEQSLWKPFLPSVGLASIVGRPDSGKSMFARAFALAVAVGDSEYLGFPLHPTRRRALYIVTEDSRQATLDIFRRQTMARLCDPDTDVDARQALERFYFIFGDSMTPQDLLIQLAALLEERPYDLVVIDSFGDAFTGKDANSNSEVRAALRPYHQLANQHECLILFVSHINKAGYNAAPDQLHAQGASAYAQKLRTILDFKVDPKDAALRYLSVTKGNAIPHEYKVNALALSFDSETFLYTNTGETVPIGEIGQKALGGHLAVNWTAAFLGREEVSSRELVEFLHNHYSIKERQSREYISRYLKKTRFGYYRLPGERMADANEADPSSSTEEPFKTAPTYI